MVLATFLRGHPCFSACFDLSSDSFAFTIENSVKYLILPLSSPIPSPPEADANKSTKMSGGRYAHTSSGVNSQGNSYTSYAGGGYAYNNAPSSGQPHGSTYFTPTASSASSGAGFYSSKGPAGSGPSFYQNSSGGRSYSSSSKK